MLPPISYVEVLTPTVTIFEDRAFKESNKVRWDSKDRTLTQ